MKINDIIYEKSDTVTISKNKKPDFKIMILFMQTLNSFLISLNTTVQPNINQICYKRQVAFGKDNQIFKSIRSKLKRTIHKFIATYQKKYKVNL